MCEFIGLPSEAVAKEFLDAQSDTELDSFCSFTDVEAVFGFDEDTRRSHAQLRWEWDYEQEVFVVVKGRIDIGADRGWGKTWPRDETD
jgi:hypothetical protein